MARKKNPTSWDPVQRGKRLQELRERLGYSQDKLAQELGVTKSTVFEWEKGENQFLSDDNVEQLSRKFKIDKNYFDKEDASLSSVFTSKLLSNNNVNQLILHDLGNIEKYSTGSYNTILKEYKNSIVNIKLPSKDEARSVFYTFNYGEQIGEMTWRGYVRFKLKNRNNSKKIALPIFIEMLNHNDIEISQEEFWQKEYDNIDELFDKYFHELSISSKTENFYIFVIAPQPLVFDLGRKFASFPHVEIFQPNRCSFSWNWGAYEEWEGYKVEQPKILKNIIALNLSLSSDISNSIIFDILGVDTSICSITINNPDNDFLISKRQLLEFKIIFRKVLDDIISTHCECSILHLFLSVPIAIAFEMGRLWDENKDPVIKLYGREINSDNYYLIRTFGDIHRLG